MVCVSPKKKHAYTIDRYDIFSGKPIIVHVGRKHLNHPEYRNQKFNPPSPWHEDVLGLSRTCSKLNRLTVVDLPWIWWFWFKLSAKIIISRMRKECWWFSWSCCPSPFSSPSDDISRSSKINTVDIILYNNVIVVIAIVIIIYYYRILCIYIYPKNDNNSDDDTLWQ